MTGSFDAVRASLTFVYVAVAGIVIGIFLGFISCVASRFLIDARLNVVWSFLMGWAAYLIGEVMGASGVLATVACGVMLAREQHMSLAASARTQASAVWDVAEFAMESLLFIIIGLSLRGVLARFAGDWAPVIGLVPATIAVFATLVLARAAWIFPATYLPRAMLPRLRRRDPFPPIAVPALVSWAGMRAVVSLAAALSLSSSFPGRDFILVVTFGVIAGTIFSGRHTGAAGKSRCRPRVCARAEAHPERSRVTL